MTEATNQQIATISRIKDKLREKCYVVIFDIQGEVESVKDTIMYQVHYGTPNTRNPAKCVKQWDVIDPDEKWSDRNPRMWNEVKDCAMQIIRELMFDHANVKVDVRWYTIDMDGKVWEN